MLGDAQLLDDLCEFARLEWTSGDLEPWATLIDGTSETLDQEQILWLLKLYNATDSMGSAAQAFARWQGPYSWASAPDRKDIADLPIMLERRNLLGGRIVRSLDSYVENLAGMTQFAWVRQAVKAEDPHASWNRLMAMLRGVWGVGRLAAFEWTEFVAKCTPLPIEAPDACLWESSGPRESLEHIYGLTKPSPAELNAVATHARSIIRRQTDITLPWVDFETVICDFKVMRKGRYYPGRHLAALREEIDEAPSPLDDMLLRVWYETVPDPWCHIAPGIEKSLLPLYRDSGFIVDDPMWRPAA